MPKRLRALCYHLSAWALAVLAVSVWSDFGWVGFPLVNARVAVINGLMIACAWPVAASGVRLIGDEALPLSISRGRLLVMGGVSVGLGAWEDYGWVGLEAMPATVSSVRTTIYVGAAIYVGASLRWTGGLSASPKETGADR